MEVQKTKCVVSLELYIDWGNFVSSWTQTNRASSQKDMDVVNCHFTCFARLSLQMHASKLSVQVFIVHTGSLHLRIGVIILNL